MSNYRRYFNDINRTIFITFVTYKRANILIENIDILRNSFKLAKNKFDFEIIAITIMKNHCHMILSVNDTKLLPNIIRAIKYNFSANIPTQYIFQELTTSAKKRGEKGVWQRRYYDHVIRDEEDLYKHIDYIHYNSMKHYGIVPLEWKYSSFSKFVDNNYYDKNWCNFDDINKIAELDFE